MEMNGFMGSFYRASVFISRLAYINLLWILFTLMGLIVFGFMPATVAMFAVTRKWVNGADDFPIFKRFWQHYKEEIIKSNLFGLFFVFIGYILYVNFMIVADQVLWMTIVRYILLVASILYIVTVLMFFPVYVHLQLKGPEYIKTALLLGIAYPQYTIIMVVGIVGIQYIMMFLPGLIPFFTASLISYLLTKVVKVVFKVVERKNKELEEVEIAKEVQVY
ncbi:YesL family protein [Halalkalibacter alkalisediminis]|uniref:YesL family protein n=1 Tax=Halalkalibacter alkalisediminis TaxID=935616 RepID=A0ABV6NC08_9BACI|nr:YesL family protein [Halalkalibacter alkalisediminis]